MDKLINGWLGRLLYFRFNFSPRVLLKQGFADKRMLSPRIHNQYIRPFANKADRHGPYLLAQSLVGASDWYQAQWGRLGVFDNTPIQFIWGEKDAFINRDYLEKWINRFPNARVERLACGHFVQEEALNECLATMNDFLRHS